MTIFTFETTIEGVELEVEVEYHEHEAQTLEHPGVEEGYDVLGIKILSEGADIMALLENAAHPGRGGYDGFLLGLVGDCASYHKHFDVVEEDEGRARFVPSSKRPRFAPLTVTAINTDGSFTAAIQKTEESS